MRAMIELGEKELKEILYGAAFFGSGGGGSLEFGSQLVEEILTQMTKRRTPVRIVTVDEVGDRERTAVVAVIGSPANIGAPSATGESNLNPERIIMLAQTKALKAIELVIKNRQNKKEKPFAPELAFDLLYETLGQTPSYTLTVEIGAANVFIAMLTGVLKNLPIVDCDGAGRSVPELSLTTYAVKEISVSPTALVSQVDTDIKAALYAKTSSEMEALIRPTISTDQFGQMGGLAIYPLKGKQLREPQVVLSGTIARAQLLGSAILQAKQAGTDPVRAVLDFLGEDGFLLFNGTISKVVEETAGGFDRGIVTLANDAGEQIDIIYKNENMIVWQTDRPLPLAMGPDLICYLTPEGEPITNADLAEGKKEFIGTQLYLIGVKCLPELRRDPLLQEFLRVIKALGYYGSYVPIEVLQAPR